MSGIEETPARHEALRGDGARISSSARCSPSGPPTGTGSATLADLRGRRVGTLGGTIAYEILLRAKGSDGLEPVSYDDDVNPYADLARGRLDAVLLDHILAERSVKKNPTLAIQPGVVETGHYVGVLAKGNGELRERVDEVLKARMRDGTLKRIFERWGVWDAGQQRLFDRVAGGAPAAGACGERPAVARDADAPLPAVPLLGGARDDRPLLSRDGARRRRWASPSPPGGSTARRPSARS